MKDNKVLMRLEKMENEIKELRSDLKRDSSIIELAGKWKDFETREGKGLKELKKEIYEKRKGGSRRFPG